MDGGSTDNSVAIIKKYEKYLTYWQSRPDGGQYAAINDGFRKTTGKIMTWLNSDDKYHPNAFITVAALFQSRNDVEWITGRSNTFNENGCQKWICEYLLPYSRSNYLKRKFNDPWIQQEGTFWRRSLWERSGATLKAELEFAGDLELWTRFFRYSRLHVVDALIAGYRYQPRSKTRLFMDKYLKEADKIIDNEIKQFNNFARHDLLNPPEPIGTSEARQAIDNLLGGGVPGDWSRSGTEHSFTGGFDLAVKFYERAVEADSDNFKARNSLGMLYWQCGEIKKSIKQFISTLKIAPDYPAAALNLGDVIANIGDSDLKIKLYASYLSDHPHFKELFKKLANFEMDQQEMRYL
jgi:tetratricopeptide (TPR) repeat protein